MNSYLEGALEITVCGRRPNSGVKRWRMMACTAIAFPVVLAAPVSAQSVAESVDGGGSDIVVTARKRQESILKVPVIMSAVSQEQLSNLQVTDITDLPRLVTGLQLVGNVLSIGPQVTLRGVGTTAYDPGIDQSISLNIDGLSLGQGLAFRSGMFDVAQVEVMKGPQALFYGKSSPGGVIALRTADPTDDFELTARAAYDFEAREARGELIVSGPLSDRLGARFATTYSKGDGYFRNLAVPLANTGAAAPYSREPRPRNFMVRGTLLWKPSDSFSARLKINHAYDSSINPEMSQLTNCPEPNQALGFGSGAPGSPIPAPPNALTPVDPVPVIVGDDCKLNRKVHNVYMDPAAFPGLPNGGVPFLKNKQNFGTLELNYDLSPELALTSSTAFYHVRSSSLYGRASAAGPFLAVSNPKFTRREILQEMRLNSDYAGPLNFSLGAFYQDGRLYDRVRFHRNRAFGFIPAAVDADRASTLSIKTYSAFGQLRYKPVEQLEVAGGVRWTDETRSLRVYNFLNNTDLTPTLPQSRLSSSNFSPEATISYLPSDDLTVFASYKKGYKSGSFAVAVPAVAGEDKSFGDEQVQGYEIGLKSRLLDRSLLLNLAFYDYYYKGLQVGGIVPTDAGVPVVRTVNAGRARTYGVDLDLAYEPAAVEGLSLNASVSWNRARYTELDNIGCYFNQTIAAGCVNFPNPTARDPVTGQPRFTAQALGGTQMVRAPKWSANFGFDYEIPLVSGLRLQLTNSNQLSSKYPTFPAVGVPNDSHIQDGFVKVDASLALKGRDDRWEIALIGRNITNKITGSICSAGNWAGGSFLGDNNTGGASPSAAGLPETSCYTDVGRSAWIRLTWRPFQ